MLVTRKPAERVLSGKIPEKSSIDPAIANKPAQESNLPAGSAGVMTSVPVRNQVIEKPNTPKEALIPAYNKPELPPLAAIQPLPMAKISAEITEPAIHRAMRYTETPVTYPETRELASVSEPSPVSVLGSFVKKLNLWKAAEKAVTGFNYLTESRLSLVRTTDENGKFSSLTLESEDYIISDNKVK
jgi:hypothetical protein